jgi:predicted transcriptional regulator
MTNQGRLKQLVARAAEMGVSVHIAHLPPPYRGFYEHEAHRIVLDFTLTPNEQASVLAHELGHAHHGHACEGNADAERLADTYAAMLMIDPDDFAAAERISSDRHFLADELNVTTELIDAYRAHCLTRLRGVTYARPRMGVRQWAYRSSNA